MRTSFHAVILVAVLSQALVPGDVTAGEFNPVLDIGDKAPSWKKLPGVDGKEHSLDDFKKKDVLVVFFTCNSCPYAVDYEDRVVAFAKKHVKKDSKVGLVAINVNLVKQDLMPEMKKKAKEKGFTFPYLFDESQQIARDFGAGFTPEFFVLNKDRKVVYMGAFDDSPNADKVRKKHVDLAVEAALGGESPEVKETVPIGCRIRIERRRRKRTKNQRAAAAADSAVQQERVRNRFRIRQGSFNREPQASAATSDPKLPGQLCFKQTRTRRWLALNRELVSDPSKVETGLRVERSEQGTHEAFSKKHSHCCAFQRAVQTLRPL